jgi:hypothetical protein
MDGKPTVETFLEIILPKIDSEIPAGTTPTEAASILLGVERGVREAFANGRHAEEEAQNLAPAPGHYTEIRAQDFTLVDAWGNDRAGLHVVGNDAVLTMRDSRGRPRLRIRAGDNEAMITICGERGEAGKGVLSATDEVERIRIGYESASQNPRVVIQDGNEHECVALSIFAEGDGFIRLRQPRDGRHTIVDSDGLIAFDGKHEPLPEYKDRQAAAPTTAPARAANIETPKADPAPERQAEGQVETEYRFGSFLNPAQARGSVNDEAIRDLVERIIHRDDDEGAKAFIALINAIAYNDDHCDRDSIAL